MKTGRGGNYDLLFLLLLRNLRNLGYYVVSTSGRWYNVGTLR